MGWEKIYHVLGVVIFEEDYSLNVLFEIDIPYKMIERLDTLIYPVPELMPVPPKAPRLYGSYIISDNPHGLYEISFEEKGTNSFVMNLFYLERENSNLQFYIYK